LFNLLGWSIYIFPVFVARHLLTWYAPIYSSHAVGRCCCKISSQNPLLFSLKKSPSAHCCRRLNTVAMLPTRQITSTRSQRHASSEWLYNGQTTSHGTSRFQRALVASLNAAIIYKYLSAWSQRCDLCVRIDRPFTRQCQRCS